MVSLESLAVFQKLNIEVQYDPTIILLSIDPREMNTHVCKKNQNTKNLVFE